MVLTILNYYHLTLGGEQLETCCVANLVKSHGVLEQAGRLVQFLQQVVGMAVVRVVVVVVVNVMVVVGAAVQVKVPKMGRRTRGNTTTMANTTNTKPFFTNANDFISTKE